MDAAMLRDTLVYLGIRSVNGVMAFATLAVFTRMLSSDDYGRLSLGLAAVGIGASVLFQWLGTSVNRFHGGATEGREVLLATVIRLWALIAFVVVGVGVAAALLISVPGISASGVMAIAAGIVAMGLLAVVQQVVNARGEAGRYGRIAATRSIAALAMGAAALWLGLGVDGVLLTYALAAVVAVLAGRAPLIAWAGRSGDKVMRRDLFAYGAPHVLTFASIMLLDYSDRFILSYWHGAASVGAYSAGYDLSQQSVGVLLNVFYLSSFPHLVRVWEAGPREDLHPHLDRLSSSLLLMAGLVVCLFIVTAPAMAALVFGPGIAAQAAPIMPIVAVAVAVGGVKSYLLDVPFQLEKRTGDQFRIVLVVVATNVLGNLLLVPHYGTMGAACSAVTAFSVGAIISYVVGRRRGIMVPLGSAVARLTAVVGCVAVPGRLLSARMSHLFEQGNLQAFISRASVDVPAGLLSLAELVAEGALVLLLYGVAVLAFDLGGARTVHLARWGRQIGAT